MRTDEHLKEYRSQILGDDVAGINSSQIGSLSETQLTPSPDPPPEGSSSRHEHDLMADFPHRHACDYCGADFGCQHESCKPTSEQTCEQCDVPLIEAAFDGACEPMNPGGHASYGSIVRVNGQVVYSKSGYCGHGPKMSCNAAEYCGAIDSLTEAVRHKGNITLRGDSKLVIMQLGPDPKLGSKRWKAKGGLYLPYYKKAFALVNQYRGRIRFEWVPRKDNAVCDELSKKALHDRGVKLRESWGETIRNKRARKHKKHNQPKSRRWHKRKGAKDSNKKEEHV
jgi:ribonuclease HI